MPDQMLMEPDWVLPPGVRAFVTTRSGGHSAGPWHSFNLAQHVQDDAKAVDANRQQLLSRIQQRTGAQSLALQWVQQVHGTDVLRLAGTAQQQSVPTADAIYTTEASIACGVLTADCLPVLFCSADGAEVAVAHAGWRGLCNGVLEATVGQFTAAPSQILTWMGPAIAQCHFEVGAEVRAAFCQRAEPADLAATQDCFVPGAISGKWNGDLYALARIRLKAAGLREVSGAPHCTVCDATHFYSYRHQAVTGRFATLIAKIR